MKNIFLLLAFLICTTVSAQENRRVYKTNNVSKNEKQDEVISNRIVKNKAKNAKSTSKKEAVPLNENLRITKRKKDQ